MRAGPSTSSSERRPVLAVQLPKKKAAIIGLGIPLGAILLFPQGIVPAVLKLVHTRVRVWFVALYLLKALQWPGCFVMIVLGAAVYSLVLWTVRTAKKASRHPEGAIPVVTLFYWPKLLRRYEATRLSVQ